MLTIAVSEAIEPVIREDGSVRFISDEPFPGSEPTGKRGDIHHRILTGPAAAAFRQWYESVNAEALAEAIETGSVSFDVTDKGRKRGAPRESAPSFAATLAARKAAAESVKGAKGAK